MKPSGFAALALTLACMALFAVVLTLSGCALGLAQMSDEWCGSHPNAGETRCHGNPAQSWDQANLKKGDRGCPTSIYIAPGGNLEQC